MHTGWPVRSAATFCWHKFGGYDWAAEKTAPCSCKIGMAFDLGNIVEIPYQSLHIMYSH